MICPKCKGKKEEIGLFPCWAEGVPKKQRKPYVVIPCIQCGGNGIVSNKTPQWMKNGDIIKDRRISYRLTLRNACKLLKMNAIVLSEMERGAREPDMSIDYCRIKLIKK